MVSLILWLIKIIIIYFIFKVVLSWLKVLMAVKNKPGQNKTKRFDTHNKDVSDAHYKDLK